MEKHGDNFWYVSLNNRRPTNRKIISIQIKKNYSIIELATEADPDSIDRCKLIYLGCGFFFDLEIQKELMKHVRLADRNLTMTERW
ncbi:hypothetical protein [Enterococcus avium]|uniref:hypothetical protein n=1 Tax=Enterococcus avium TaxID=33945 RepID=UPI00288DE525|nr:hypothetical protein [Enterococcus avium]MDT2485038.1 hypothetical protein [Enterococcus avium]MDT2511624.1 hypothetical protein [Enterococcus avium]